MAIGSIRPFCLEFPFHNMFKPDKKILTLIIIPEKSPTQSF